MTFKILKTQLREDEIKELNRISALEHLDSDILVRKWILQAMEDYRIEQNVKLYQMGKVSLAEMATRAKIPLWQMTDYVIQNNIRPPPEDLQEIEKEIDENIPY